MTQGKEEREQQASLLLVAKKKGLIIFEKAPRTEGQLQESFPP